MTDEATENNRPVTVSFDLEYSQTIRELCGRHQSLINFFRILIDQEQGRQLKRKAHTAQVDLGVIPPTEKKETGT